MGKAIAAISLMIQDQNFGATGADMVETKHLEIDDDTHDRFLDGPTCRRVGIVDFDPATARPTAAPAAFTPFNAATPSRGRYDTEDLARDSPQFLAVNAFGTVFETIRMFEEPGALGRRIEWAFDGEQLLVVPRAGQWANAFYERATRSLQFFWFESPIGRVYTALSRDIVAHECGHALLDAVVPSLHDSLTPESIAIHEAVADLFAVLMALRSDPLRAQVLAANANSIADATAFSSIAERFGIARPRPDEPRPHALRDLRNNRTMSSVDVRKPHELSTVLSAIFYESLIDMFESLKRRWSAPPRPPEFDVAAAANRALASSAIIFRRLLSRGIDYLPPGELTFADVARATIGADRAADVTLAPQAQAKKEAARSRFADRFVARGVAPTAADLDSTTPPSLAVRPKRLPDLRDSDWVAYSFVQKHRAEFGIPRGATFTVLPRVDATKEIGVRAPDDQRYQLQRELILKVAWDHVEANGSGAVQVAQRRVRTGATLAWRWDDGSVLALVRSNVLSAEQRTARDTMLTELLDDGRAAVVDTDEAAADQTGVGTGITVRVLGGVARISGTQRLLHVEGGS